MHLHIKLNAYLDLVICTNIYIQILKTYSIDKKYESWKLQNSKCTEYESTVEIR